MLLKLIRGASYTNDHVRVTRSRPLIEAYDETAAELLASGFFVPVDDDGPVHKPPSEEPAPKSTRRRRSHG